MRHRLGPDAVRWPERMALCALILSALGEVARSSEQAIPPTALSGEPAWASGLTGSWVSLVTDNWRFRMVTPPKGDYQGLPVTAAAVAAANLWDPEKDAAEGLQCKSYGAGMIMMRPEHLRIRQDGKSALIVDIDAGSQQRVFYFSAQAPSNVAASWQGYSSAVWMPRATPGFIRSPVNARYLHVKTTHMLPGYLRQNGVPYSGDAELTEDFDIEKVSEKETYLVITSSLSDPVNLDYPLILTAVFRKQPDGENWKQTPCSSTW